MEEIQHPFMPHRLTRGLMEVKLARNGLASKVNHAYGESRGNSPDWSVQGGISSTSAIPSRMAWVWESIPPPGLMVHSGDYKFDHTPVDNWPSDYAKLAEFSERGVLALLADSTNAERPGWTPSERVVDAALDKVFREAPGTDHRRQFRLAHLPHSAGGKCC